MTEASIEIYSASFDGIEDCILAYKPGSGFHGLCSNRRIGGADDANASGGVHGMGKADAAADSRAILEGTQAYSKVVLGGCWRAADFESLNVAGSRKRA